MTEASLEAEQKPHERSAHELSSCLLELSRLVRGTTFYPATDPHRAELLDRTHSALDSELARCGELQLAADGRHIEIAGMDESLDGPHIEHLAQAIHEQRIAGISLAPGLHRDAIEGLALLLASDATELDASTAFEPWYGLGIAVISAEQLDPPVETTEPSAPIAPAESIEATAAESIDPIEADPQPEAGVREEPSESASEAAPFLDTTEDTETLEIDPPAPEPDDSAPQRSEDVQSRTLTAWLGRLEAATGGEAYIHACAETLEAADTVANRGRPDEAYQAILLFTEHASGASGLDDDSRANAQASLRELCDGEMLQYTISRACGQSDPRAEVRAAQVLLQLGEPAVPGVLERLRVARDPERLAQLSAVVIALGERAVEPMSQELSAKGRTPSRVAIQLAGELQNPQLVASLTTVLHSGDSTRRNDAARSLVTIGRASSQVLVDALSTRDEELTRIAIHCLGRLGDRRAGRPLTATLERALRDKRDGLARDAMRALGELGDANAIPALIEVASRRDWLRRSRHKDLSLVAIGAIERIAGNAAERALQQLRGSADSQVCERASEALARRAAAEPATAG